MHLTYFFLLTYFECCFSSLLGWLYTWNIQLSRVCCRINGFYNDVELKFKATSGDGQLLWISDEPNVEFLSVGLRDGFVELGYNVGGGDLWMMWSRYRVDDSKWHVVNIKRSVSPYLPFSYVHLRIHIRADIAHRPTVSDSSLIS